MRAELKVVASNQSGVFTRAQAVAAGYSDHDIRFQVRRRAWVGVRRSVYAEREVWDALDEWRGQPLARDWAAHLTMTKQHVMSHHAAGRAHDLSLLRPRRPELTHVTRPGVGGSRTEHHVKHHKNQDLPWVGAVAAGLPVTPLARTALDIAREDGLRAGMCAVDSAMRAGVRAEDFLREARLMRHWRWITVAREAVGLGDPGAENAGETLARQLVLESLPGEVLTQVPVRVANGRLFWVDMLVGCHAIEFDGRIKYGRDGGGTAWDEKERQRLICAEELGMSRIIWDDFWGEAREAARQRIRAEAAVTTRVYGSVRPARFDALLDRLAAERRERIFGVQRGPTAS